MPRHNFSNIFDTNLLLGHSHFYSLIDVKEASVDLADETLKFKGKSENKEYEVDIAFFKPVDSKGSTYKVLPRSVQMHVMKKDKEEEEFWPRLLKDKALEKNQVKIDWDRYVDEDEEEEGFDTSAVSFVFYIFVIIFSTAVCLDLFPPQTNLISH